MKIKDMKISKLQIGLIFFIASYLTNDHPKVDAAIVISDTLKENSRNHKIERNVFVDALTWHNDALYNNLELNLTEISKHEFQSCIGKYKTSCVLDSGKFISGSGLYVMHNGKETFETYLAEKNTNRKMLIPSTYDAGILKMLLSPSCNQLVVCSSYDGPDYENYYEYRAEIFLFNVSTGIGLKGITPALNYYTKDWSINDLTWVDEHTIALELYNGTRTGNEENLKFRYFKSNLKGK
ncbi:hypothetical protein SAMN05421820_101318 [Pedobacter steynii]|uniref:Uncharacterized protein n=1 Tax=Pedobacter steynii TaxID=430522 RepID=A0A1G9JN56_9SPHI|nr:hypothetical protein [Pedobacter steynii]NQX38303.1 hypothetical protein [Pedobacter steynii]SDL38881.1 hypothetical protein SAMN05421820_101318 [Pedobacter steynii]